MAKDSYESSDLVILERADWTETVGIVSLPIST